MEAACRHTWPWTLNHQDNGMMNTRMVKSHLFATIKVACVRNFRLIHLLFNAPYTLHIIIHIMKHFSLLIRMDFLWPHRPLLSIFLLTKIMEWSQKLLSICCSKWKRRRSCFSMGSLHQHLPYHNHIKIRVDRCLPERVYWGVAVEWRNEVAVQFLGLQPTQWYKSKPCRLQFWDSWWMEWFKW